MRPSEQDELFGKIDKPIKFLDIKKFLLKSNGLFSILKDPYDKKQHCNQQNGLDRYIDIVDHRTGEVNSVKLYENKIGLFFKKNGSNYLSGFTQKAFFIPFQIIKKEGDEG